MSLGYVLRGYPREYNEELSRAANLTNQETAVVLILVADLNLGVKGDIN